MFYEMQFQLGKAAESTLAALPYESIESIENSNRAIIIFEARKNSLFLNTVAKQVLEDRTDVSVIGDWIRSRVENLKATEIFKLSELPLELNITNQSQNEDAEVLLRKLEVSAEFKQKLNEHESLIIRESTLESNYVRGLKISPPEPETVTAINYDLLTGLPNYNLLLKYIEQEIDFCHQRKNYQFVVLFIDINRFEVINSSLGRILADRLLVAITQRLKQCLRTDDFIARMGNDEFAILLSNVNRLNHATNVAERIYHQLGIPFNIEGYEVFLEVSIGIAVGNDEYSKPEHLLRDVELAVSDAKRQSKFSYRIFEPSMRGKALTLLQLENDLRKAIKNDEFILYYQPIVYLDSNTVQGFEALVRWRHPKQGIVNPEKFISLAESTGLIVPLGFWVLKEACQQMYDWVATYKINNWKISVNISSKQLELPNFVAQVKQIIKETNINPHNLKLEITESSLVEDTQHTILVIRELKALGIEFSLDDFGTGYSSLSYLHQFPFDTIKIDRSFVNSFKDNDEKIGIVRAIVSLANNLGMNTIAEGIETDDQLAHLKALKCQYGQGYYLSKPLDKQIVETVIATEISKPQTVELPNERLLLDEQIAKEQLLFEIAHLRQEVEQLKAEKKDFEIMLETTTQHADLVESQLHNEICDRRKAQAALSLANRELEQLCVLDGLTQVANRRRFDDYLVREWQKLQQEKAPISLILCDIDYFKLYNDTYGHPIGDYCLQQVALAIECIIESIPGLVARYGGEEFGIILPNTEQEIALQTAEKIALSIEQLHIIHPKSLVSEHVTLSLGVYGLVPNSESSPELLIALADKALYLAKDRGRNRACLYVDEQGQFSKST